MVVELSLLLILDIILQFRQIRSDSDIKCTSETREILICLQMTGLLPIVRDVTAIHRSRFHYPLINMHVLSLTT